MEIKEQYKKKYNEKFSEDHLNRIITDKICSYCIDYIIEQLIETNGLLFMVHYYNICYQKLNVFEEFTQMFKINEEKEK